MPLPVPLLPEEMEIHGALLAVVQAHPLAAVTATLPVEAISVWDRDVGEIEYAQLTLA